jgi:molecular chaperone DnaK (HSP70)
MDDKDNKLSNLDRPLTTWQIMKKTADADELKELQEVENRSKHQTLQRLKSEQYRANTKGYFKPNGEKVTLHQLYKQNTSKRELKKFWAVIKQHKNSCTKEKLQIQSTTRKNKKN